MVFYFGMCIRDGELGMKGILALVAPVVFFLVGCSWNTTLEIGVGAYVGNGPGEFNDRDACSVTLRHESSDGWYVEVTHVSICTSGTPFNDDTETWTDEVRVGKVWVLREGDKKNEP